MGRKSKITPEQWADIGKRLLEGETPSDLGREFGVGESTIRSHFERKGQKTQTIQAVAGKLFEAEHAQKDAEASLKSLPMEGQVAALTLFKRLKNISDNLACAAENSSATAVRFTALANTEAQKVDDALPMGKKSADSIKASMVLTKAANEAAHIPLNLLSANRERVKELVNEPPASDETLSPDRLKDGARRIAFMLHKAAAMENT